MILPLINAIGKFQTKTAVAQPNRKTTRYIVIHHAAWTYDPSTACTSIFNYHSSKWPEYGRIGYQEVIQEELDRSLACYQVNPPDMQGANVAKRNHECFGICAATNFTGIPTERWMNALADRAAAAKRRWPDAQIVGHTDIALEGYETACPGPRWKEWRPTLLNRIQALLIPQPAPKPADSTAVWAERWGPIATPTAESWAWDIPRIWQTNWQRLGKCISHAQYDALNHVVVQCFEGGDIRCRSGKCEIVVLVAKQ